MLEKKRQDKIKTTAVLEKTIAEILVANGRSVEPFVKVFTYSGENVAKGPLGTLVGIFEIADRSEDSAYIVNFLASVAKKEYFNNPRRGAIESFEAALHKINLALAEIVKQGNIAWLGKCHGALGILEKNNLHFSVTGQAAILLFRNNNFSDISQGLASEESHVHPIKTFVEVSSGRLQPQDKIIFTSPELLGLLPLEDLEKNALRMDRGHFEQFLRTVLVNELDMAGTVVIDFQESRPAATPQKQEEKTEEVPQNVFSQKAFVPKTKAPGTDSSQKEKEKETPAPEEYVDSKTGHIYIQGNTPGEIPSNQNLERIKFSLQNVLHALSSFFVSQGRLLRKGKKYGLLLFAELAKKSSAASRKAARFLRRQLRKRFSQKPPVTPSIPTPKMEERVTSPLEEPRPLSSPTSQPVPPLTEEKREASLPSATPEDTEIPLFMRAKLAAFYQKNGIPKLFVSSEKTPAQNFVDSARSALSSAAKIFQRGFALLFSSGKRLLLAARILFRRVFFLLKNLSPQKQKAILFGSIASVAILALSIFLLTHPSSKNPVPIAEAPQPQAETPAFPLTTEKNAHLIESLTTLITREDPTVASVLLDNETYLITEKNIVSVSDKKQFALPGSGSARLAAPMDHLSLIFLYTDAGELFAWSPISRTFVKNTLTLPEGATVRDIGTYLTYLYVLDASTDQIYRFPRAEGGFGPGLAWMKDSVAIEDNAKMAVNETIFLAPNKSTVQAFFRGRLVKNLESPNTPLSVTSLFTHPGLANVYALDAEYKRILVWNQDGTLLAQYFSDQLADTKTITVNEKTNEIFLTTSSSLLSFKLSIE